MAVGWELREACHWPASSCTWWTTQGLFAISQPLVLTTICVLMKGGEEQMGPPSRSVLKGALAPENPVHLCSSASLPFWGDCRETLSSTRAGSLVLEDIRLSSVTTLQLIPVPTHCGVVYSVAPPPPPHTRSESQVLWVMIPTSLESILIFIITLTSGEKVLPSQVTKTSP